MLVAGTGLQQSPPHRRPVGAPMSIPPELIPVLVQFPIVGLVFIAAWVVLKWADHRHQQELTREESRTAEFRKAAADEVQRVREDMKQIRADNQEALKQARDELRAEIARLRARNTQLQNELDSIYHRKSTEGKP